MSAAAFQTAPGSWGGCRPRPDVPAPPRTEGSGCRDGQGGTGPLAWHSRPKRCGAGIGRFAGAQMARDRRPRNAEDIAPAILWRGGGAARPLGRKLRA